MKVRAAVLYEQGLPRPYAVSQPLKIEQVTLEPPGEGEVLIEIAAAGLCHSDLSAIEGLRPRKLPSVPGHEAAGIVVEVGPGVRDLKKGDHVVSSVVSSCGGCPFCARGRLTLCTSVAEPRKNGTLANGGRRLRLGSELLYHWSGLSVFAEHAVVMAASLVRVEKDIPLEDAALVSCAVMTGTGAIFNTARVEPGDTVGIVGLGGVGMSALLAAVAAGASRIIAIDTNPAKLEIAKRFGATDVFSATQEGCVELVQAATAGGCDHVIETAGSVPAMKTAYGITARGGTTVAVGLPHPSAEFSYPQGALVSDERRIVGSYMGGGSPLRDIPRILSLYRQGKLPFEKLRSNVVGFDQINEGFDQLADGAVLRNMLKPF
ncbi:zinc-binding dehydrogenase [Bordetella genomosp. 12]|uniref:Alcohol dehydrogenase n=1 Tax=Bordetella genomosp. 12 TaxID=463035 RepID=A0A261V9W8_9BORD|nr:zinc-binding dehydrogenase [Bordetella genomosp. 12]OZI70956.1 alcohol dehydrogenase [Bordetella genomosp. 12]